jgi:uncharacterized coiled-coil protein SlyX
MPTVVSELWDAIAELRDELNALSDRIDNVHTQALRALTDALQPREKKQ